MRVNMSLAAKPRPPSILLKHWCSLLSEEYLVEESDAMSWVYNSHTRSFVVDFLQSRGWKVEGYTTPPLNSDSHKVISQGFVIADDCDELIKWKLTQS